MGFEGASDGEKVALDATVFSCSVSIVVADARYSPLNVNRINSICGMPMVPLWLSWAVSLVENRGTRNRQAINICKKKCQKDASV